MGDWIYNAVCLNGNCKNKGIGDLWDFMGFMMVIQNGMFET